MKKTKVILSIILMLSILTVSILPAFAESVTALDGDEQVKNESKISMFLKEKMEKAEDDEEILVWIWFTNINTNELDNKIKGVMGEKTEDIYKRIMDNTDKKSTKQTKEINTLVETYLSTRRTLARTENIMNNNSIIKELGIAKKDIVFQSELTSSVIIYATKETIKELVGSDRVIEIGFFDDRIDSNDAKRENILSINNRSTLISYSDEKAELEHDLALQKYNVTGDGINVLHFDHDFVRSNFLNYYDIPHPENIHNVIRHQLVTPTSIDDIPIQPITNHANHCVGVLQSFAENVHVYSIAKQSSSDAYNNNLPENSPLKINAFDDVEYSIINYNINLINASCNEGYAGYGSGVNDDYSSKWFDAIVNQYRIPLVASAGNNQYGIREVLSPANSYNSIAVGAYNPENNQLHDFSYNPLYESNRIAYKPDIIVPMDNHSATSSAAPAVSGIIAMMFNLDSSLKAFPEIVKAILIASCHDKATTYIDNVIDPNENINYGLTQKQGAGKVNVLRALNIINAGTFGYGVLQPENSQIVIDSFYLNSSVFDENTDITMNSSLAWLRRNTKTPNNGDLHDIVNIGIKHELNLRLYYSSQPINSIKESTTINSGKQMVFYDNPTQNKNYNIKVIRSVEDTNDNDLILFGYAYSVNKQEKVLDKVELIGEPAIGNTVTAKAYTIDNSIADNDALTYQWSKSQNGINWQNISGATNSSYTITDQDFHCYLRCRVTQNFLYEPEIVEKTNEYIVRYGDADIDGSITIFDITLIQQYLIGLISLTNEQMLAADVDGDNEITIEDAMLIQNYLSGGIVHFPVESLI